MYLSHYGFERAPFDAAHQPDHVFETPSHDEALASVIYGILEAKGFIALLGEVGVGKTTVLRRALDYVRTTDPNLMIIELANPALAPAALAARIEHALRPDGEGAAPADADPLEAALRGLATSGRRVVLVIDEAQDVAPATLELLRILSNLDRAGRPLVQTVLSGQPELDGLMARAPQRAVRQRIAVRAYIRPLTRREVAAYLCFRLQAAGAEARAVISRAAIGRIAWASGGFPRRANIIADNALLAGLAAGHRRVGWCAVGAALRALDAGSQHPQHRLRARLAWATAAALALAALGWAGLPALARLADSVASTSTSSPQHP
jgi:type II secretory pathway predicted ATPase ExeA